MTPSDMSEPTPPRIRVTIVDESGSLRRAARIPAFEPLRDIIPALADVLGLPSASPDGIPLTHHIIFGDRVLQDYQTLAGAGVADGDKIMITSELLAVLSYSDVTRTETLPPTRVSNQSGLDRKSYEQERMKSVLTPKSVSREDVLQLDHEKDLKQSFGGQDTTFLLSEDAIKRLQEYLARLEATDGVPPTTPKQQKPPATRLRVKLDVDFATVGPDEQTRLISLLAELAGVTPDEIQILAVEPGSTVIDFLISNSGARQLVELGLNNRVLLAQLKVEQIEIPVAILPQSSPGPTRSGSGDKSPSTVTIGPDALPQSTIFTVAWDAEDNIRFEVVGAVTYRHAQHYPLTAPLKNLETAERSIRSAVALRLRDIDNRQWFTIAGTEGRRIYAGLMEKLPTGKWFSTASEANFRCASSDEYMTVILEGPEKYLAFPYELLWDDTAPLMSRFAVVRHVTGVPCKAENWSAFAGQLRRKPAILQVLLIASHFDDVDPAVNSDAEIQSLSRRLDDLARQRGLDVAVTLLPSDKCSYESVEKALSLRTFHIIHYAGPCVFNSTNGDDSALLLGDVSHARSSGSRPRERISALDLAQLLRNSDTRLFYVNSGESAASAFPPVEDQICFGVCHALVKASIPYVLGFRWDINRPAAVDFAETFYQSLFETHSPGRAALAARSKQFRRDRHDPSWVSSVLVTQPV